MNDINNVVVSGRLTDDPKVFETKGGLEIWSADIAINKSWKKDGEWQESVNFIKIKRFKYSIKAVKGDHVTVVGSLDIENWEDKEGNKRSTPAIIVSQLLKDPKQSTSSAEGEDEPGF